MNKALLDHVVAPNLLDAVADPEIVFTLVLANLMSSRLWEQAGKLPETEATGTAASVAGRIQQLIDHHYEHVSPQQVFETNGKLDMAAEAQRLGQDVFDYTLEKITASMDWRARRGTYDAVKSGLDHFKLGELPAYVYATIDEARAYRRLMRGRKHKPHGITCCLDEAALFAAMMIAQKDGSADRMMFMGSPAHYTVLCWTAGDVWWFYGKHDLFSAADWEALVHERYDGDWQMAFNDRLPGFDRIMTASGLANFHDRETSIPEPEFTALASRIDDFLGGRVTQLDGALASPFTLVEDTHIQEAFAAIRGARDAEAVRQGLQHLARTKQQPAALRALYAYRTMEVPDHDIYLQAARRSTYMDKVIEPPRSLDEAIAIVAGIQGADSIFEDRDRIAMPDETLRFATGTDRDKALLLHVILERFYEKRCSGPAPIETIITAQDSYVVGPEFCFSLKSLARVPAAEGTALYRFGTGCPE